MISNVYFLNRELTHLLERKFTRRDLHNLKNVTKNEFMKRVRPELRKRLELMFNDDLQNIFEFEEIKSSVGQTYVMFVSNDNTNGITLILKVEYDSNRKETNPELFGSAKNYKDHLHQAFSFVQRIIQNNLTDSYIPPFLLNKIVMKFLNPLFVTEENLSLKGNSLDLPLSIAIFSTLLDKPIPNNIAASGKITDDLKVTYVEGLWQKIESAIFEYPEINKIVLPSDCKYKINPIDNVEYIFVSDLREAIEIFFPGIFNNFESLKIKGKIDLIKKIIKIDEGKEGVEITLNYKYPQEGGERLDTEILKYIDLNKIVEENIKKGISYILLNNFRPTWLVAGLMDAFINKVNMVAIWDLERYVVVYSKDKKFRKGDIINIKDVNF